jgi:hypothetical protein
MAGISASPAPLARDDLVALRLAWIAARQWAHHDGLHHALRLDRLSQLVQRLGAHIEPRLIFASLQQI